MDASKTFIQKNTSWLSGTKNTRCMAGIRNLEVNSIFQDDLH